MRDPIEIYYPEALAVAGACSAQTTTNVIPGCTSYNSNVGNAVYQGVEARFVQHFAQQHLYMTAMYGLNVAYPKDLNANFSNPTSGANLVNNQQFPGIPQQQGSLEFDWAQGRWHAATQAIFRGYNNELSQGPITWIDASVGFKLSDENDLMLQGTNLFNDAAGTIHAVRRRRSVSRGRRNFAADRSSLRRAVWASAHLHRTHVRRRAL